MIAAERVSVVVTVTGTVKGVGANAPILASINYSLKLNRKEVSRMKKSFLVISMMLILAIVLVGCATQSDLEKVQAQEIQNRAKADQAAQDAQAAKATADAATVKAEAAAARAENAVKMAEERAKAAEEKEKMAAEKAKIAEEKEKMAAEKAKAAEEKEKIAEEKTKVAEEKAKKADEVFRKSMKK